MFITANSSLTMVNCLYAQNNAVSHLVSTASDINIVRTIFVNNSLTQAVTGPRGILVANGTQITLGSSTFHRNRIFGNFASLMTISAKKIAIHQCVFSLNILHIPFSIPHTTPFISIDLSSYCSILDTTIDDNHVNYIFEARYQAIFTVSSSNRVPGSYVQIGNCTFKANNMIHAHIRGISDIFINHSSFFLPKRNNIETGDMYMIGIKSLRLWDSTFYDQRKITQLYFKYDFSYLKETNFLTLNTKFALHKSTLETCEDNFLQKAESKGVINSSFFTKLYHEETSYAAS